MSEYGPRASIRRIGVAEPIDDGVWLVQNWSFDCRHDPSIHGVTYDAEGRIIAVCGWALNDLRALSDDQIALSMIPVADRPL